MTYEHRYPPHQLRKSSPPFKPALVEWRKEKQNETDKIVLGVSTFDFILFHLPSLLFVFPVFFGILSFLLCVFHSSNSIPLRSVVCSLTGFAPRFNIVSQSNITASCFSRTKLDSFASYHVHVCMLMYIVLCTPVRVCIRMKEHVRVYIRMVVNTSL